MDEVWDVIDAPGWYSSDSGAYPDRVYPTKVTNISSHETLSQSKSAAMNLNWQQDISNGVDASTSYSRTVRSYWSSGLGIGETRKFAQNPETVPDALVRHYRFAGEKYLLNGEYAPSHDEGIAFDRALVKLRDKIRAVNTAFEGMVALGELTETIGMLINPIQSLRDAIERFPRELNKRLVGRQFDVIVGAIAGTYLEAVFGWRPFINDINSICKTIDVVRRKRVGTIRLQAQGQDSTSSTDQNNGSAQMFNTYTRSWINTSVLDVKLICGGDAGQFESRATLARIWGFSPERFLPSVYALLPYSWLADYFANINELIDAACDISYDWNYIVKNTRQTCTKVTSVHVDASANEASCPKGTFISSEGFIGVSTRKVVRFTRTALPSLPLPSFRTKVPNRVSQWLNIGALFAVHYKLGKTLQRLIGSSPRNPYGKVYGINRNKRFPKLL